MKFRFPAVALSALLLAALPFLGACASEDQAVATVNGEKITKGQLDQRLEGQAGKPTLQQMVDQDLVLQYGRQNHIDVSDKEIGDWLAQLQTRFPPGQFEQVIAQQGLTMDDVRNIGRVQLTVKKAVDRNINVSQSQVADFFNRNRSLYDTPEQVCARHILVKTKPEADSIEGQLRRGGDFAAIARKNSQDPGSASKGGDLGCFGQTQMVPPFSAAAFSLRPGQISQPVQTQFGWHIIQVQSKKPAHHATLAEVSSKVRDNLMQQQETAAENPFVQQLRNSAKIVVSDNRFNPLFPTPVPTGPAPAASGAPAGATPAPAASK